MTTDTLTCVAVDDDPMTLRIIESLIKKTDFLSLSGAFTNPVKALESLSKKPVDLLFLDIEMPELSGLDLLGTIERKPEVIVISRKEDYALEAFNYEVTDYLLKPLTDYSRFLKAVLRAKRNLELVSQPADSKGQIFIKVDSLLTSFDLDDILWAEGYGDYVKMKTADKLHVIYTTLRHLESRLPNDRFIRVHRSYLVNGRKIENIDSGNLQIEDKIIPISKTHREELMRRIQTL